MARGRCLRRANIYGGYWPALGTGGEHWPESKLPFARAEFQFGGLGAVTSSWAVWHRRRRAGGADRQHRGKPSPTDQVITAAARYIVGLRRGMAGDGAC